MRHHATLRLGATIAELVAALVLTGIILGVAIPRMRHAVDRAAVRGAAADVIATLSAARQLAVSHRGGVWVAIDPSSTLRVVRHGDTPITRALGQLFGVTVEATRDSRAYDACGLGGGAAKLTFVLLWGARDDTVVVSRVGRVRW